MSAKSDKIKGNKTKSNKGKWNKVKDNKIKGNKAKVDPKKEYGLFTYKEVQNHPFLQFVISNEGFSCPFNYAGRLDCATCKQGICLISQKEIAEQIRKGNSAVKSKVHVCSTKIDVVSLLKFKSQLSKEKVVKDDKVENKEENSDE